MTPYYSDRHCDSFVEEEHLRDGCARLQLIFRTWIHFHPAGHYKEDGEVWAVDDWTAEGRSRFKTRFAEVIRDGFGDGAIWILHNQTGVRDVWCDVKIVHETERSKAHLCVNALNNPTAVAGSGGYRSNCLRGGESLLGSVFSLDNPMDMSVTNDVVVGGLVSRTKPVSDAPAPVTFLQNVLLHEFGHYLGLRHFCDWAGEPNASEQYCANRTTYEQDDLMAVGNSIRSHHVNPFLSRLGKHEYVPRASCFGFVANDRQKRPWIGDPNWSWAQ